MASNGIVDWHGLADRSAIQGLHLTVFVQRRTVINRPVLLFLPLGFACSRRLVDHRGVDHGSIDSSDFMFANVVSLKGGGTYHRRVGFAKSFDRRRSLGQIVLPKRLAVHRRIGRICIQLAKCAGDSF